MEKVIKTNKHTDLETLEAVKIDADKYPGTETLYSAALPIFSIQLCLPQYLVRCVLLSLSVFHRVEAGPRIFVGLGVQITSFYALAIILTNGKGGETVIARLRFQSGPVGHGRFFRPSSSWDLAVD